MRSIVVPPVIYWLLGVGWKDNIPISELIDGITGEVTIGSRYLAAPL